MKPEEKILRQMFDAMVAAAQPATCLPPHLPDLRKGRALVLGAGKAGASMAQAVEMAWPDENLTGLVIVPTGYGLPTNKIEIVEASHPIPDQAGADAAQRILNMADAFAAGAGPDDLALVLLSGGGSALMAVPIDGISLSDKQAVTKALLESGASIQDINCVRKHLSAVKGGRLAERLGPVRKLTLAISDVVGDGPSVIASGPMTADPTTVSDARAILDRYAIAGKDHLVETSKTVSGDYRLIVTPTEALKAAAAVGRGAGFEIVDLGAEVMGEAREVARDHARRIAELPSGTILLSGGELTVTHGHEISDLPKGGGPNREYLMALKAVLDRPVFALAADTDGIDGSDAVAGAIMTPDQTGPDPEPYLAAHASSAFWKAMGSEIVTGPTYTNVNDFRAILIP
ncbi:ttuD [Symbiodinium microadriaticum]|nr:ttuD [Symbiodinium microadriaticum]